MAHKSHKIQSEIVAVLGLIALFTHMHIFWIAALLLAMIDLPDFGTSLGRIADSTEKMAGRKLSEGASGTAAKRGGCRTNNTDEACLESTMRQSNGRARTTSSDCWLTNPARTPSARKGSSAMFELLLCSLLTIVPDYLYRRYAQGKRLGKEITFYSVWFELRWGITSCLILTVALITVIFYNHPPPQRHAILSNRPDRSGDQWSRCRGLRWRKRPNRQRSADLQAGQLEAGGRSGECAAENCGD